MGMAENDQKACAEPDIVQIKMRLEFIRNKKYRKVTLIGTVF
jgi:hypothetical protein